jgi:hypothetical protein
MENTESPDYHGDQAKSTKIRLDDLPDERCGKALKLLARTIEDLGITYVMFHERRAMNDLIAAGLAIRLEHKMLTPTMALLRPKPSPSYANRRRQRRIEKMNARGGK